MDLEEIEINLPNKTKDIPDIEDYQEYFLLKKDLIFKVIVGMKKNEIFININNYMISLDLNSFISITNIYFASLKEAYEFINNNFEINNVTIKNLKIKKEIIIIMIIDSKIIEFKLIYNKEKNFNNYFFNEIRKLKSDIAKLSEENKKLVSEIDLLKKFNKNEHPKKLKVFSNLVDDSCGYVSMDNTFTVFKSIHNILFLIYSTYDKSIISYDINSQKKISEIKSNHNEFITNLKHYLDKINKRDLIMSISREENLIKIWDVYNWNCILNLRNIYNTGWTNTACLLSENNQNYIITCNRNNGGNCCPMKVFDFNGNKIKDINNSNEQTFFIDTYYDINRSNFFLLTGNEGYIKSYDYYKNNVYLKYEDPDFLSSKEIHISIVIQKSDSIIKLIVSCYDGYIRIWNFYSPKLLKKIKICDGLIHGISLWSNNYLFAGCNDHTIKLIDLKNGLIIKSFTGHDNEVITVKAITHPKYGKCLISQNWQLSKIKLWVNKNYLIK